MHDLLAPAFRSVTPLAPEDTFLRRHLGVDADEIAEMLETVGFASVDALIDAAAPGAIRFHEPLPLPAPASESEALQEIASLAAQNRVCRNYIGQGYSGTHTPPVIQRNILENPGWYTAYTPYQAEIAQGRLEALLNFQQTIIDLTGLDIANASLLDEATAAAEAMHMAHALSRHAGPGAIFISQRCHGQTISVVRTRAEALGIDAIVGDEQTFAFGGNPVFAVLLQYPATDGAIFDYTGIIERAHAAGGLAIVAADLLSLALLRPPGEFGADIAIGSAQRFGVPIGFGGPHAAYMASRDAHKRVMPGRLVGVSKDASGAPAYRLSLQTREQHIRRDKATSNICTAQVLLAVMASMYAVYHGPHGLRRIAERVHRLASTLALGLAKLGFRLGDSPFFDTIRVEAGDASGAIFDRAAASAINLRKLSASTLCIALDETTTAADVEALWAIFNNGKSAGFSADALASETETELPVPLARATPYLTHPVFNTHHTETEMLRYIRRLEAKDLSLTTSMIPLGSCTMKLNATSEMLPLTWPAFSQMHPFCPPEQSKGYAKLALQLQDWLAAITGFHSICLEPNAGSQGEYAGLLVIRKYLESKGENNRKICLIPQSAHGTNPASAVMAGFKVVPVACLQDGDIDIADLRAKADAHASDLAALMVTYPSTHGVFEEGITEMCAIVHAHGGQVYMDGANLNAQVGICRPARIGADVCHLNLHKTFCIPHGGGGPGMGPIGVAAHLALFLPETSPEPGGERSGAISAAPLSSASILTISWMYIRMMGGDGLALATRIAILNANYIARRLDRYFPVLYKGRSGLVAHECILDLRHFKKSTAEDVAKRLIDYGFHAPTLSWPVPGTLMVEPTESESKAEIDRFCDAMMSIHAEMSAVESGAADSANNLLKNAPHTASAVCADYWEHPYPREQAAFPAAGLRTHKYWPPVSRIDNVWGDRNLFCACAPV